MHLPRFPVWLGLTLAAATALPAATDYPLGPDSMPHDGVPRGVVTKHTQESKIYAGTVRDYWVYVPAQYHFPQRACLLVVQDGERRIDPQGDVRMPFVLDNLINRGEMPVTIAVFINPGTFPAAAGRPARSNRSFEYDTLSDQYARFLHEEILPEVARKHQVVFTDDPAGRAITGQSSGGICAFTVAWERPDSFRKVASFIGSFTAIAYRPAKDGQPMQPGGDLYPTLIRKNPIKPLKVFLQDGANDLNNVHGSWFLANQQMLSALEWANANADTGKVAGPRYQVNHAWGDEAHNGKHAGAIFPEVMRWLWAGYKPAP
ncbi:MAG: alpha/beta hydrolase-fold protein [Opitutaceae bacterium]